MTEAVKVSVRYDTKRDFGGKEPETRRDFNMRFGQSPGPELYIPPAFTYLWEWFWALASRRQVSQGSIGPITYTDIEHWMNVMRLDVRVEEIQILLEMDEAYLESSSIEHESLRARKQQSAAPSPKKGR